jgi:hypothetical protein
LRDERLLRHAADDFGAAGFAAAVRAASFVWARGATASASASAATAGTDLRV